MSGTRDMAYYNGDHFKGGNHFSGGVHFKPISWFGACNAAVVFEVTTLWNSTELLFYASLTNLLIRCFPIQFGHHGYRLDCYVFYFLLHSVLEWGYFLCQ